MLVALTMRVSMGLMICLSGALTVSWLQAQESRTQGIAPEQGTSGISAKLLDSLALESVRLEIARASNRVERSSFWHRLLPRITASAGISLGGEMLVMANGTEPAPPIARSSFRLAVSIPISELFASQEHSDAEIALRKLRLAEEEIIVRMKAAVENARRKRGAAAAERQLLAGQLKMLEHIHSFRQMQFDSGARDFESLVRSEMDLLAMKIRLANLDAELNDLSAEPEQSR
jgi:outer membrane protein TolC